jgi:hypothetical protein
MKKELPGKIIRETEMIMSQVELPEDGKK